MGFGGERRIVLSRHCKTSNTAAVFAPLHHHQFGREPVDGFVVGKRLMNPITKRAGVVELWF